LKSFEGNWKGVVSDFLIQSRKKLAKFSLSSLNDRNDSADSEYWNKYENLIDDKKNKLWDSMLYSLQKYQ